MVFSVLIYRSCLLSLRLQTSAGSSRSLLYQFHVDVTLLLKFNLVASQFSGPISSDFVMSISRVYTIIGDANIRRNMTSLNIASRDVMKKAEVIDCLQLSSLDSALSQVRVESSILIVASITEFLLAGGDCGTIASSIDHILTSFAAKVTGHCAAHPAVQVNASSI